MLEKINTPEDVRKLTLLEKEKLAEEIRRYILEIVSENGGHLASNLGVVELSIALHSVFNTPKDKIIWDVGHQTYVHKILTGRREELKNLRKLGGIAGFPKTKESEYDSFNTGHSSTSISAALGMARARDIKGDKNSVIAVIGDGALTGGMAIEALNDAGYSKCKMTVVLNDNEMSISPNIGGLNMFLSKLRTKKLYTKSNISAKKFISKIPVIGKPFVKIVRRVKRSIKQLIIPKMFFEEIGFTYLGPVDGHNIEQLENILRLSKQIDTPVLIHVLTKKGKGYKIAEDTPDKFHATGPFNIETGEPKKKKSKDYSKTFGNKLVEMAEKNDKIVAITASMKDGTGLTEFQKRFPKRFFDIGIAEQHAITLAAGMASEGLIPFVPIYSSFYQRAYDQVIHDVAIQNLPVIMCVDRAGIVGADGETHQGLLDMAFFRIVPNLTIMAPKDFKELEDMMEYAITLHSPVVIRYPRGEENKDICFEQHEKLEIGKVEFLKRFQETEKKAIKEEIEQKLEEKSAEMAEENKIKSNNKNEEMIQDKGIENKKVAIIAIGKMVAKAMKISKQEEEKGNNTCVINVRFLKPFDKEDIIQILNKADKVITIEDGAMINGLATVIKEIIAEEKITNIDFQTYAYPDEFIQHGTVDELEKMYLGI